MSMWYFKRVNS